MIAICVPVRDEEQALPALLVALAAQRLPDADVTCCFLLDGCRDGSAEVLRAATAALPFRIVVKAVPPGAAANAGRARRAAVAIGIDAVGASRAALLLTTDADSVPAPNWILASTQALREADVAAGVLTRTEPHLLQTRIETYYDRLHRYRRSVDPVRWDPSDGRHFSGGANLAIRASTYLAIGGFREIASGEDAALLDDASRAGFRVRRDPAMVVATSSRRQGRASGGLATALAGLDRDGPPDMPHPGSAAWQYRAHARARAAFPRLSDEAVRNGLGHLLDLTADHVLGVGRDCPNAEAFAMRIVPAAPAGTRLVPLAEAEMALSRLELDLAGAAA